MASRVRINDLQEIENFKDADVFVVVDSDTGASRKVRFHKLKEHTSAFELGDFDENQHYLLQAGLASGNLFVKNLQIGG